MLSQDVASGNYAVQLGYRYIYYGLLLCESVVHSVISCYVYLHFMEEEHEEKLHGTNQHQGLQIFASYFQTMIS